MNQPFPSGPPMYQAPAPQAPSAPAQKKSRRWMTVAATAVGGLLLGVGIGTTQASDPTLVEARETAESDAQDARDELADTQGEVDALQAQVDELNDVVALADSDADDTTTPVATDDDHVPAPQVESPAPPPSDEPAPSGLSIGQQNAVGSAESYLSFSSFSRQGLIDQLLYEGFSTEDATYAVDSLSVDWNEQAASTAESYLSFSSFSRQGLIDQLLYEGFSQSQAEYGAAAVGY
ncbi:MAG: Ltp family lipoprotein [Actinomycetaceae bacterium]